MIAKLYKAFIIVSLVQIAVGLSYTLTLPFHTFVHHQQQQHLRDTIILSSDKS